MRYFLSFSYLGTPFHGSQSQPNGVTVQSVLESAFATILRQPVPLTFAGRTDAGVHADMMVAHFDFPNPLPPNLAPRLNNLLPPAIAVRDLYPVPDEAHARFDALERTYHYRIITRKDPFLYPTHTRVAPGLDFDAMNTAAQLLLGKQDFASFCRTHTDVKTTICDVREARWIQTSDTEAFFVISADRFLRNMVRAVVGTLFDVGRSKIPPSRLAAILAAHDRTLAGHSAPPEGLSLVAIKYPLDIPITRNLDNSISR